MIEFPEDQDIRIELDKHLEQLQFEDVDAMKMKIFQRFLSIHKTQIQIMNKVAKKYGLYHGHLLCLKLIEQYSGISQSQLAKSMDLKRATITSLLQKLEKNDLIIRKSDLKDQRIICVNITEKGKNIVSNFSKEMSKQLNLWYQSISQEEYPIYMELIRKICCQLEKSYLEIIQKDGE